MINNDNGLYEWHQSQEPTGAELDEMFAALEREQNERELEELRFLNHLEAA